MKKRKNKKNKKNQIDEDDVENEDDQWGSKNVTIPCPLCTCPLNNMCWKSF